VQVFQLKVIKRRYSLPNLAVIIFPRKIMDMICIAKHAIIVEEASEELGGKKPFKGKRIPVEALCTPSESGDHKGGGTLV
jgi:hypothetical protein